MKLRKKKIICTKTGFASALQVDKPEIEAGRIEVTEVRSREAGDNMDAQVLGSPFDGKVVVNRKYPRSILTGLPTADQSRKKAQMILELHDARIARRASCLP